MGKKMLIDATHPEETRVVVVDGNKVDDFDFESINKRQLAGNIYLAKVTRVEPSLQAAFVDYGGNRHGFLAFSEIHPDYYQIPIADREALLAEEERAALEDRQADDDAVDRKPPKKSSRSRSSRREKPTTGKTKTEKVSGLEVISVDDDRDPSPDGSASDSLAVVDPVSNEEHSGTETNAPSDAVAPDQTLTESKASNADEPGPDQSKIDGSNQTTEAAPLKSEEAGQSSPPEKEQETEEVKTEETDPDAAINPKPPKSMAESSGLEEESVSEEIAETADSSAPQAKESAEKAIVDVQSEGPATTDSISESPSQSDASGDSSVVTTDGSVGTAEPIADEVAESGSEGDPEETQPRKRSRRSRRRKGDKPTKTEKESAGSSDEPNSENHVDADDDVESVGAEDLQEEVASSRARRRRNYKIQDVVKVRQILLVQVVKEERGNKGAALTTYLSLAGRYCVLMPNTARGGGISRKITQAGDRKRLREIVDELEVPKGMGLIVRTAGAERTRAEIKRDYEFLSRQWEQVRDLTLKSIAPTLIYEEGSLIKRSIRDLYSKEIDTILVEGETGYREAKDYMKMLMPSHAKNVQQYGEQIPLYVRYQVESYLNGMFSPTVQLKSGGYIVIGVTEALVAIDVNSGRATKQGSIEETALQTNLEAADEVARQCRLRDLAGLIVVDFIDMEENRNNRAVEKRMKERLKNDRARIQIGRISSFGLMEMSRQRLRPGMLEATTSPCPHCHGTGVIRSDENMALSILREVEEEAVRGRSAEITVTAPIDVANFLLNQKREHIARIEERSRVSVIIVGNPSLTSPDFKIDRSKQASKTVSRTNDAVTADSVVTSDDIQDIPDNENNERQSASDDKSDRDGKSRRRRGKRGGRRRRGQETSADQTNEGDVADADTSEVPEDAVRTEDGLATENGPTEATISGETGPIKDDPSSGQSETAEAAEEVLETSSLDTIADDDNGSQSMPSDDHNPKRDQSVEVDETIVSDGVDSAPAETVDEAKPDRPKRRGWWSIRA
ncbi:MAG: Rne/Rng family ribonuclease [Pseudomonadota bacterium]